MYAKLYSRDLNLGHYPSHPAKTYTCRVIITPKGRGNLYNFYNLM